MASRIRDHGWAATPLGPMQRWPERLKLMVEQVLASPLVSSLVCGPEHVLIYNDAAAALYGDRHPAALGRPLPETFPEGWATVAPFYARAFAGEAVQVVGHSLDTRGAGVASDVFDALLMPVRDADGRVALIHMTGSEIGARRCAEAALRASEARHRLLIESWAHAVWETDGVGVVIADSPSWRAYTGQTLAQWFGYGWLDAIHPDDRSYAERQWRAAISGCTPVNAEFRLRAPGGGWRWTNVRAAPVLNAGGHVEKWVGINIDIDVRRRAEAALRESEDRQAFLLAFSDALRAEPSADAVADRAIRMLSQHMQLDRCYLADYRLDEDRADITHQTGNDRVSPMPETIRLSDFPEAFRDVFGETLVIRDVLGEPGLSHADRQNMLGLGMGALLAPTLRKGARRPLWVIVAISARPRRWTHGEIALAEDVAERTWAAVERARAEAALRESEALLTATIESVPVGIAVIDMSGTAVISNGEYRRFLPSGIIPSRDPERVGRWRAWDEEGRLIDPQEFPGSRVLRGERVVPGQEMLHTDDQGRDIWVRVGTVPVRDTAGQVTGGVTVVSNIDALKRSTEALCESEARFAQFAASSSDALWIRDAATLAMEYTSPAIRTIYGVAPDSILGGLERWTELVVPEDRVSVRTHLERAKAGASVVHEFRIRRPSDGEERWIRNTEFPLRDEQGRVQRIGGLAEDVTEARALRERQAVLVAELQHRTRNLMSVVRAMADKTMARSTDLADFRLRYSDRMAALARVQGLLSRLAEGERVTFDALIHAEMAALSGEAGRFSLDGPEGVALRSSSVQTFALALHELGTNAVKHGAFSQAEGRLDIRWRVERAEKDGRSWLHLDWRERSVRMPTEDAASRDGGSGRELIERALPYQLGARTTFMMEADGVHCTIALPVSQRQAVREMADA